MIIVDLRTSCQLCGYLVPTQEEWEEIDSPEHNETCDGLCELGSSRCWCEHDPNDDTCAICVDE